MDISSSNFTVEWDPPPAHTHNGIIRSYHLNVTELNTGRNFIRETTEEFFVLDHLYPYYVYQFMVVAVTVKAGPPTEPVMVTTLETGEDSL